MTGRPWRRGGLERRWRGGSTRPGRLRGALLRGRDLDERRHRGEQGQDVGGGPVAQRGARAGDEQRRRTGARGSGSRRGRPRTRRGGSGAAARPARGARSPSRRARARAAAPGRRPRPAGSRAARSPRPRRLHVDLNYWGQRAIARIMRPIIAPAPRRHARATNRHTSAAQPWRTNPPPQCPPFSDPSSCTASGSPSPAARARRSSSASRELGATTGHDVLVHRRRTAARRRRRPRRARRRLGRDPRPRCSRPTPRR